MEHEPGAYEFTNYNLFTNLGYIQDNSGAKKDFSIPFEIERGQITYLGDLIFYPKGNSEGYLFQWTDNYKREVPILRANFPKIDWDDVKNNTLQEGFDLPRV